MRKKVIFFMLGLSLLGFALSVLVHVLTFLGINPEGVFPGVWVLHVFIFVVFAPVIILQKVRAKPGQNVLKEIIVQLPRWMKSVCVLFFVYAIVNFGLLMVNTEGGTANAKGDKYILQSRGNVIRELTKEEYQQQQAYGVRGFSGHWMVFYLASACGYFVFMKDEVRAGA